MLLEANLYSGFYWDIVKNGLHGLERSKVFLPFSGRRFPFSKICNVRVEKGCQFKPINGSTRFFVGFLVKEEAEITNGNHKIEEDFKKDSWRANISVFMDLKDIYKSVLLGKRLLFLPMSGWKIRTGHCKGCGRRGVYFRDIQVLCAYDFAFVVWFGMSVFLKRDQKHCVFCMPNCETGYLVDALERRYKITAHGSMFREMNESGPVFSSEIKTFFGPVSY